MISRDYIEKFLGGIWYGVQDCWRQLSGPDEGFKGRENVSIVSLSLTVDGYTVVDDDTFDQKDFIERVAKSPTCPKSSCPSPEDYMNAFGLDNVGCLRGHIVRGTEWFL